LILILILSPRTKIKFSRKLLNAKPNRKLQSQLMAKTYGGERLAVIHKMNSFYAL